MAEDIQNRIGDSDSIVFLGKFMPEHNIAAKYIREDTREYFLLASRQVTIPVPNGTYMDILTPEGVKLFKLAEEYYKNGQVKGHLEDYYYEYTNSGFWAADRASIHFNPKTDSVSSLNTFENRRIIGYSRRDDMVLATSSVIFGTDEWAYTASGSIYSLGRKNMVYR